MLTFQSAAVKPAKGDTGVYKDISDAYNGCNYSCCGDGHYENKMGMDYLKIIRKAWEEYDATKVISKIEDISPMVSTNCVFRITFEDEDIIIAKLSYFGKYENFKEDHRIIHSLSNNLLYPFENLLAKSLLRNNRVYTYRYKKGKTDAWVVFYNPVRVLQRMPKRLDEAHIRRFGQQIGKFHKACSRLRNVLPKSSKTLRTDIHALMERVKHDEKEFGGAAHAELVRHHCELFLKNRFKLNVGEFEIIPVFIDWNIGNFSVTSKQELYSRWDYDWFRMSYRMLDFYFFSRVVSDAGDKTVFSYNIDTMMQDRFILFLQEYHKINPLTANELRFLKEAYRFFILNYVIKDGNYFFNEQYAKKLQAEAYDIYLPSIDTDFDAEKLIHALKIKEEKPVNA
jgi:Ser/Thr protein kinase RdoA (MazF antagonist)